MYSTCVSSKLCKFISTELTDECDGSALEWYLFDGHGPLPLQASLLTQGWTPTTSMKKWFFGIYFYCSRISSKCLLNFTHPTKWPRWQTHTQIFHKINFGIFCINISTPSIGIINYVLQQNIFGNFEIFLKKIVIVFLQVSGQMGRPFGLVQVNLSKSCSLKLIFFGKHGFFLFLHNYGKVLLYFELNRNVFNLNSLGTTCHFFACKSLDLFSGSTKDSQPGGSDGEV